MGVKLASLEIQAFGVGDFFKFIRIQEVYISRIRNCCIKTSLKQTMQPGLFMSSQCNCDGSLAESLSILLTEKRSLWGVMHCEYDADRSRFSVLY